MLQAEAALAETARACAEQSEASWWIRESLAEEPHVAPMAPGAVPMIDDPRKFAQAMSENRAWQGREVADALRVVRDALELYPAAEVERDGEGEQDVA